MLPAALFSRNSKRLASLLSSSRWEPFWRATWSFAAIFAVYRGFLFWQLEHSELVPFGVRPREFRAVDILAVFFWDACTAVLLAIAFGLWTPKRKTFRRLLATLRILGVTAVAFLSFLHLRLMLARGDTLGPLVLDDLLAGGGLRPEEMWEYGEVSDYVGFLIACALALALALSGKPRALRPNWTRPRLAVVVLTLLSAMCLPWARAEPAPVLQNPIQFVSLAFLHGGWDIDSSSKGWTAFASVNPREYVGFRDSALVTREPREVPSFDRTRAPENWNVVWVVMESTGAEYVFQRAPSGGPVAMPFLKTLAKEGWWMKNHRSTSNSSHRSLYSLYTGLYPSFGREYFCLTDEIDVPTLPQFLGEKYRSFLFTAGSIRTYFPTSLFKRNGFSDLTDKVRFAKKHGKLEASEDGEFRIFDAFLKRMVKTKEPFFASYYSGLPHYHYDDHGAEFRIAPNLKDPKHRYFNNLRALDTMIERIVNELKASGRYERTILVFVGDHGEAFGQHGRYTHASDSHEEQLRAPWILHVPNGEDFATNEPTSHVDLVPTLLDLMEIPYDPRLFQGESLLSPVRTRKYTFAVGNERSWVSIGQEGTKLIESVKAKTCTAHDLKKDPNEKHGGQCDSAREQLEALNLFGVPQEGRLRAYSAWGQEHRK